MVDVLAKLNDDKHYYGRLGKMYLSNSDIGILLGNPRMYGQSLAQPSVNMILGRYLHTALLEPEKLANFIICDAATRNNAKYREIMKNSNEPIMLTKEKMHLDKLVKMVNDSEELSSLIYAKGNQYEVPAIGEIHGLEWKGKADIISELNVLDVKTTSDINKFRKSAYMYNYDSQSFIYEELFKKRMKFLVIDKEKEILGIFEASDEFVERGELKAYRAAEVYKRFFIENAPENINNYVLKDVL